MRKIIYISALLTLILLVATPASVLAVETSPSLRQEIKTIKQEKRQVVAARKADRLEKYCTVVEQRIMNLLRRIESRMAKQKADGKDVTAVEAAVTEAKTHINTATSMCQQAVAKYDAVPTDKWSAQHPFVVEARGFAKQAHDAFVNARKAVSQALKSLAANNNKETPTIKITQ
ncbi:MAG: hypothetical protein HZA34_02685 [Candidatus Pacebacteria bacterium]|nr:hypothetical protein [Candidatus Paceibacterota bacterium]